jgi:hypothetical protein
VLKSANEISKAVQLRRLLNLDTEYLPPLGKRRSFEWLLPIFDELATE